MTAVARELEAVESGELRAYVAWLPVLAGDGPGDAAQAAARARDSRARHYWDEGARLGHALGAALAIPDGLAWDVYLVYPRGARWGDAPAFWMHQLREHRDRLAAPLLDAAVLRARLEALLPRR